MQVRSFKCEDHLWKYIKERAEEQDITSGEFLRQLIQKDMEYSGVKLPRKNKKKPGAGDNRKKIIRSKEKFDGAEEFLLLKRSTVEETLSKLLPTRK